MTDRKSTFADQAAQLFIDGKLVSCASPEYHQRFSDQVRPSTLKLIVGDDYKYPEGKILRCYSENNQLHIQVDQYRLSLTPSDPICLKNGAAIPATWFVAYSYDDGGCTPFERDSAIGIWTLQSLLTRQAEKWIVLK